MIPAKADHRTTLPACEIIPGDLLPGKTGLFEVDRVEHTDTITLHLKPTIHRTGHTDIRTLTLPPDKQLRRRLP